MADKKGELILSALSAKKKSGKSFDEIAKEIGLTNVYTANLFYFQAHLKAPVVDKLKAAVPALTEEVLEAMQAAPVRTYSKELIQDPFVYRLNEAVMHNAEALRAIAFEKFGDGITSAIDFYCTLDKVKGANGETRAVVVLNGKYLPFSDGSIEKHTAQVANKIE